MGFRVRQFRRQLGLASACGLCVLLSGAVVGNGNDDVAGMTTPPDRELRFARLAYSNNSLGGGFRGRGAWQTDAPDAEYHLLMGIRRLTRIDAIDPESNQFLPTQVDSPELRRDEFGALSPGNPRLYEFPFLYAVEVGRWYLDDTEALALREYLERGGFLMVDDFHGSLQWEGFMESMRRVFPDREVEDIPDDHEVFHVLYDLDQKVQIPGIYSVMQGTTYEEDGFDPHWRGVFDDHGRLMVAINFNMDLGDAWEHADDPGYQQNLTALAYRFAVSYALYAMTH